MIPKRIIRVWIGDLANLPFPEWWEEMQRINQGYEFVTLTGFEDTGIPSAWRPHLHLLKNKASLSDLVRILALHRMGGVYVDTDILPLKPFDSLVDDDRLFIGKRSSKSFESAVIGSPAGHPGLSAAIRAWPRWAEENSTRDTSVLTGPGFLSSVLFGRDDVNHLPTETFYPFSGFGMTRAKKDAIFEARDFPEEMVAAHFSNHRWGGKL